ncbi:putative dehydrogenase [Streptosporangium becharense]|uniref:Putative dehydrogenase n=1 Tax=Streptosporangium becharense TaxID=1816182 RepID=A0A7W9MG47_9ACTN|nr:Gfo/Idh/MocA family oxidoreductase [Streptosporangium becharense]MBB2909884.1 putative dehydrogenase [Streptosporangium becharense]MBB5819161.1 putative dehydrogenase [Streptosporangium becharense]
MSAIKWGILATGGIAATFTEDLKRLPDAEVVAVGSRTAESARAFADRHGIPRAHGSWAELAADPEVDIVYVANTQNAHYDAVRTCLEAGKAVLCEKAFTLNRAEAAKLVDLARERGLFLMEAMWMRCIPAIRKIMELVEGGAVGPVNTVHADFGISVEVGPGHRLRSPELGGGSLLDLGVYPISFAYLVLGVPDRIQSWARLTPEGVDDNTGVLLGYDRGAVALLSCGLATHSPVTASISGPLGRIELPHLFFRPDTFTLHRTEGEPETFHVPYEGSGMLHEAVEAMRCLREGLVESPLVPWEATLDVMGVMDEIRAQVGVRFPGE